MNTLSCKDIGIEGCKFATKVRDGDAAGALDRMITHLRASHGFHLSTGEVSQGDFDHLNPPERIIATRLQQQLEQV